MIKWQEQQIFTAMCATKKQSLHALREYTAILVGFIAAAGIRTVAIVG